MSRSNESKMNTENFKIYLLGKGLSSTTIERYSIIADHFFCWLKKENMSNDQVRQSDILLFMKHYQRQGVIQRTVQHYIGCVKTYYDYLVAINIVESNPVQGIKVQGVKRKILYHILESADLHALYNHYQSETLNGKKYKVIIGLLVYQGLKSNDLARLEVRHIKLKEGKIEVPEGRKGNSRVLQLEPHQVLDIYQYVMEIRPSILKIRRQESSKLFISQRSFISLNFLMAQLRKQHPKLKNADQIRASVIVKWLRQYNLREVQYMAGHRYISSTEAYLQNEMEGLSEEVNRYHPLG